MAADEATALAMALIWHHGVPAIYVVAHGIAVVINVGGFCWIGFAGWLR